MVPPIGRNGSRVGWPLRKVARHAGSLLVQPVLLTRSPPLATAQQNQNQRARESWQQHMRLENRSCLDGRQPWQDYENKRSNRSRSLAPFPPSKYRNGRVNRTQIAHCQSSQPTLSPPLQSFLRGTFGGLRQPGIEICCVSPLGWNEEPNRATRVAFSPAT